MEARMRKLVAGVFVAAVLGACGSDEPTVQAPPSEPQGKTLTIEANVSVWSDLDAQPKKPWTTGVECTSFDFQGERVQVLDADGTILGVQTFPEVGTWTKSDPSQTRAIYQWDGTCTWSTSITGLADSDIYVVELDGWEPVTFSADELEGEDWTASLDL
jgi:hypothetical protein